jgi:hypothetical protein
VDTHPICLAKGRGFGLSVQVISDHIAANTPIWNGSFGWDGAFGTHAAWVADDARRVEELLQQRRRFGAHHAFDNVRGEAISATDAHGCAWIGKVLCSDPCVSACIRG